MTIVKGQPVFDLSDGTDGTVVGLTQAYCVYLDHSWPETDR